MEVYCKNGSDSCGKPIAIDPHYHFSEQTLFPFSTGLVTKR